MKLILTMIALLSSGAAFAAEDANSANEEVAANLIIGQIRAKKLLPKDSAAIYDHLNDIAAGHSNAVVTSIDCDAILSGRSQCDIKIVNTDKSAKPNEENTFGFTLQVTVSRDGKVTSAKVTGAEG